MLDKKGFQVKFETLKHGMHTPVNKNGKCPPSPPPPLVGLLQAE